MIEVLRRRQIDTERWNNAIAASLQETIYPYTWYLDACADHWLGLVMNDYECVMPVIYRKKMGVRYTYHPSFCQQLGVYAAHQLDPEIIRMFLLRLKELFQTGDYAFNEDNLLGDEPECEVTDNTNYVLSLKDHHIGLYANYTENCRRNIKKAYKAKIEVTREVTIDEVLTIKRLGGEDRLPATHFDYARDLFTTLQQQDKIEILGARSGSHLVAAAVFGRSMKRGVYLQSASSEMGKELRAMFMIVDTFIGENAGREMKLDFEGSNIASIARFFRGFGAKPEIYQRVHFDSPTTRLIKKIKRG